MADGSARRERPRFGLSWTERARFALAVAAVLWFLIELWTVNGLGRGFLSGDVTDIFDAAGDRLRAGLPVYTHAFTGAFFYSPTYAVIYGAISWLPPQAQQGIVVVLELAALRYLGGSWYGFCYTLAFPTMNFELISGQFNMVIAAGIVMAIRGDPRLAVGTTFAKLHPVVAMDPRDWRRALPVAAIAVLITLPWLSLWPAWFGTLLEAFGSTTIGPQIPIPWLPRVAVAAVLVLAWRPWSRAAAAVLAIPAFYYSTLVMFIAPVIVLVRRIGPLESRPHPLAGLVAAVRGRR